jgi:hypothetical protein
VLTKYASKDVDGVLEMIADDFDDPAAALARWVTVDPPHSSLLGRARGMGRDALVAAIKAATRPTPTPTTPESCGRCDGNWLTNPDGSIAGGKCDRIRFGVCRDLATTKEGQPA